jgi:translation initiation factor IF-3
MPVLRFAQAAAAVIGRHWALLRAGPDCSIEQGVDGMGLPNDYIGGPISTETRINERIRVPEVRLIGPGGEQVGIVRIEDALRVAVDADLDLVEVAPDAKPPVCKIMDYGKFKYETALKERESRKNQQQTVVKEQKLRPKIDPHDYETKKGHVVRFLEAVAARVGLSPLAKAGRRRCRLRLRRDVRQAGRAQHDDDSGPAPWCEDSRKSGP